MKEINKVEASASQEKYEHPLLRDLWELSIEEIEKLKAHIEEYHGVIRIFVHPFFESAEIYPKDPEKAEKVRRIDQVLQRMAEMEPARTPAIFLLEPFRKIEELPSHFNGGSFRNKFYVVQTDSASPQPYFKGDAVGVDGNIHWSKNWSVFTDWLKELGVKKIIIGGQYLFIGTRIFNFGQHKSKKEDLELQGCVGTASRMLGQQFEIEFSNFASPKTSKDIKEAKLSPHEKY